MMLPQEDVQPNQLDQSRGHKRAHKQVIQGIESALQGPADLFSKN